MFPQLEIAAPVPSYAAVLAQHMETLKPHDSVEIDLTETIAANAWRLKLSRAKEARMMFTADPTADPVDTFIAHEKELRSIVLYENRVQEMMQSALNQLRKIQAARIAAREEAFTEAKNLAQMNYLQDKPYVPTFDFPAAKGFAFTTVEINTAVRRDQRLKEAARMAQYDFDPSRVKPTFKLNIIDGVDDELPALPDDLPWAA